MALVAYKKTGHTGGTADDLDSVDGDTLSGEEVGFVFLDGAVLFYELDESIGGAANPPSKVPPAVNPGNKRWVLHGTILGGETDFQGYYALQLQNIPDLASNGAGYWFDGADDGILTASSPIDSYPFSLVALVRPDAGNVAGVVIGLVDKSAGSVHYDVGITSNGYAICEARNTTAYQALGNTDLRETWIWIVGVFESATSRKLYVNGKLINTSTDNVTFNATVDAASIGYRADSAPSEYLLGTVAIAYAKNLALTAAEVKALSSGAPVPFKYIGASQTELMPNQVDRDFSGASAWADVDLVAGGGAYDETTDLTITAGGAGAADYCTCPVASAPTTIGKRYRMTYDLANLVGSWTLKSFDGTQTIGTISANATQGTLEWTAETTGGYRLVAAVNSASGDFDNFTLTQIGCVLNYDQPGVCHGQWIDLSGNEMHGTVSGAKATNLPANHQEKYVDLTVTGNTSFTLPMGYQIKSIICKETSGNALTGGVDIGFAVDGVDVVAGMAVGANATVLCTLIAAGTIGATHTTADDIIYISDGDNDTNWNGAELEVRVQMQRLTVN